MPARFMGNHEHGLDDKGRVIIPSKFRDVIDPEVDGSGFVITPAPEECLLLYTPAEWENICQSIAGVPRGSSQYRAFQRQLYGMAEEIKLDRQGRILVPERMRKTVHIDKEIVIAGVYDRLEIWAKPTWEAMISAGRGTFGRQMEDYLGVMAQPGSQHGPGAGPALLGTDDAHSLEGETD